MNDKTKAEREEALAFIMNEAIDMAVETNADSGKQYSFFYYFSEWNVYTYISYFIIIFYMMYTNYTL